MEIEEIVLPSKKSKIERVNPHNLILFGLPKSGKTTAVSKLENHLIIDTEDGTDFVEATKIKIPKDFGPVKKMKELKKIAAKIRKEGYPYDYVIVDSLTEVDEWAEWAGTYNYMNSLQGLSFNRKDGIKGGEMLPFGHNDYESVHNLPQGFGYRYSRQEMVDIYDSLQGLGKICTIFIVHVADKFLSKLGQQDIVVRDLGLTGKVRDIVSRKVDAVGYVYHKEEDTMISFKGDESRIGGIRSPHLRGYDDILNWNKIFIKQ